ncbi:putative signal transduction histidine-protein kinase [Podospora australis]|uniref:histidine kinase n=1 Tax=Podospora australis TaxID=1536484 RepID=A0AAN7AJ78_9PEZI|nr:putative signal transduction histidine-protein kinase [Podospora australis]
MFADCGDGLATGASCSCSVGVGTTERARQREIAAYLSAASFPPGIPTAFAEHATINSDPVLNALTQLGAYRLGCARAFVSLIDRTYQYVVTEMTKSQSLVDNAKCLPGDTVAIGVCKLRNCDGVCPATMAAFMDETGEWVKTGPDVVANRTRYIINNFRTHPDYCNRSYVVNYPYFTSYLEVPLVSPLGYLLGSYCVVDDKANQFDDDEKVEILNEISAAIVDHLENVRIRQSRDRAQQLIQGLSGFIRREPPAQHPKTANTLPASTPGQGESLPPAASEGQIAAAVSASSTMAADSSDTQSSASLERPRPQNVISASSIETSQSALSISQDSSETPPTSPREEVGDNPLEQQLEAAMAGAGTGLGANGAAPHPPASLSNSDTHGSGFISSANIKTTFFRAATTIRQSMDMDGLMFLDAVPSSYADRSDQAPLADQQELSRGQTDGPCCSAIVKSSLGPTGETITHSSQTQLPEASLQRFIRAYPQGKVFTADEFGPIDDSYGPGKPFESRRKADRKGLRLRNDIEALFRILPTAKYVIFLPLWHFQRECWYAAALGWVEDPTRAIVVTDIGLISAFGNSVMAEVSRLEALAASRAKSDFVSSLSHELRSPLHGIMASSELLRENISNSPLLSTLDMLDSCATTLLDTFNNLLDHAIVTHAGRDRGSGPPISDLRQDDLSVLVEDVVEAVRIGHLSGNAFHMQSSALRTATYPMGPVTGTTAVTGRPLLITVNIARRSDWKFLLNVGAWKRIVMNIFGNALKYTSSGRIEVRLQTVQRPDKNGQLSECISFSVEDTGSGMSSDYLKYHLFTPFSQENHHSPGMGLGLSIVQQLVSDLGGVVDVKSSVGVGTLVEVFVPFNKDDASLPSSTEGPVIPDKRKMVEDYRRQLVGRKVCLITPEAHASILGMEPIVSKEMRKWSANVERAIHINAGDALGMEVLVATADSPIPEADIYLMDSKLVGDIVKEILLPATHSHVAPLVLLCSGSGPPSCLKQEVTKSHELHLHHPLAPRKLGSVLCSALNTEPEAHSARSQNSDQGYSTAMEWIAPAPMSPPRKGVNKKHASLPPLVLPTSRLEELEIAQPPPAQLSENTTKEANPKSTTYSSSVAATTLAQIPTARHLLLVDDNPINIKLLAHVVRKLNHTFVTASHGLEAVQLYKKSLEEGARRFDLVFMDISMPVMNGFEATREIRQLEIDAGASTTKIVALTGLSGEISRNEATASGCDLFLTKPVKMNMVRGLLDEMNKADQERKVVTAPG